MSHTFTRAALLAQGVAALAASACSAQALADRIAAANSPRVQFTYAARAGVCGNGRTFIQAGESWHGSFNQNRDSEACTPGPARVIVDRAGRTIVSIAAYVGATSDSGSGIADLGTVSARNAADFLLGLAERAEGRVSRQALLPAVIADSVDVSSRLLALAANKAAPRETRRSAISWLGRPLDLRERAVSGITDALVKIARDDGDNQSVRQQAMRSLSRLEHGKGTEPLMQIAKDATRPWPAREALAALAASGDPRARQFLRDAVVRADLPDEAQVVAIRGLGGEYATGADIALIRTSYQKLDGERSRDAALSAVATFGGTENARWLLTLARQEGQSPQTRRRAVQHAYHGGVPVSEFVALYDQTTDPQTKEAVIGVLLESGERAGTDKLMNIARSDESISMRRKAVGLLSRSSDERVKQFLVQMAQQ